MVSKETEKGGIYVNEARKKLNLQPLHVHLIGDGLIKKHILVVYKFKLLFKPYKVGSITKQKLLSYTNLIIRFVRFYSYTFLIVL